MDTARHVNSMLVAASLCVVMSGCVLLRDAAPPDYGIANVVQPQHVEELVGARHDGGGGGVSASTTVSTFEWEDGRWLQAELLYADDPLPEFVTPPSQDEDRGRVVDVPVEGTSDTFRFVERPPALLDEVVGCVRVVVNSWDFEPVDQAAVTAFVAAVEEGLQGWLAQLPEDPCEGRPTSPPEGVSGQPSGVLSNG